MKRTAFILLLLTVALSMPAFSLTWQEAVSLAQKNNYQIQGAKSQSDSAQWSYYRSITPFLPQFSASASYGNSTSASSGATSNSSSYGLSVTQNLFSGLDNYYSAVSAAANNDYYRASLSKTVSDVLYSVRSAFIGLSIASESIGLQKSIVDRRKNNASLIELRYESGREDHGVLLRAKADLADAQYSLASAKRELELAKLKLSQTLSVEADNAEGALDAMPVIKPDMASLVSAVPAYIMAKKQLEQSDIAFKQTVGGFLPNASLNGSVKNSGTDWPPSSQSSSWSLNLSYSFLPGGSNIADRAIYSANLDKAKQDFRKSADDLRYDLESYYQKFMNAVDALKVAKLYLQAMTERAEIARAKYINGLLIYDEWDRIENEYIASQRNYLSSRKNALLAEAAWHNSFGGYIK